MKLMIEQAGQFAGIRHRYFPADEDAPAFGVLKFGVGMTADLHFATVAQIDAVIAELVALRNEMEPHVPSGCGQVSPDGYLCGRHEDGHHIARTPQGEMCARWPVEAAPDRSGHWEKCHYALSKPDHDEMCEQRAAGES